MPDQYVGEMHHASCEVKRVKFLLFKLHGAERFIRAKSLGDDYSREALRERCADNRTSVLNGKDDADAERKTAVYMATMKRLNTPSLIIGIQVKSCEGAGAAYVKLLRILNLKPPPALSFF